MSFWRTEEVPEDQRRANIASASKGGEKGGLME